jgi:hypothetical protein
MLALAGIVRLRFHVDNPEQYPLREGLVRLGAGGALLALPYVTLAITGSIHGSAPNIGAGPYASAFPVATP